ncbi:MAG: GNAT family N-acetyltransferase [Acidobacteria bacterium]|nr:GNAT family N-acetyltransferase [Acidobacteriota bacterium]
MGERKPVLRRASEKDFEAVLDLACQLADHIQAPRPPLTMQMYEKFYLRPGAPMQLVVAVEGERVVGMISWTLTHELYSAEARVYISDLVVGAGARGRGIGGALMNEAAAWARAHGVHKLGWDVWRFNETAKRFYERFGAHPDEEAIPYALSLKGSERSI